MIGTRNQRLKENNTLTVSKGNWDDYTQGKLVATKQQVCQQTKANENQRRVQTLIVRNKQQQQHKGDAII